MGLRDFLTAQSNYLIDWNRAGSLFFSNHRYSLQEKIERGFVITSAAVMGFLTWNASEQGGFLPFAFGASLGFLISHTITMSPLIYKRLMAQWSCNDLIDQINQKVTSQESNFISLVQSVCDDVLKSTNNTTPSATWGRRKRLLENLLEWLNTEEQMDVLTETLKKTDIVDLLDKREVTSSSSTNHFNKTA
ncbi:hypothetical protein [Legionella bononiensis]|uniref:SMODS and SLOG-associating 2TM effector domain-containing protein n=1 Tax=Legionella bononiensis TaxID=2793102 RepID=A0ABS1W6W3_9GAMM|nr:hypothetical protein [Legionella bononiensis]MBL7525107.1 hypothetical protein [Legionella bononiensis]MBL7562832.1 hypothetical protein [Legionella bononiensis]